VRPRRRATVASAFATLALLSTASVRAQTPPSPAPKSNVWVMPGAAPVPPPPWSAPVAPPQAPAPSVAPARPAPAPAPQSVRSPSAVAPSAPTPTPPSSATGVRQYERPAQPTTWSNTGNVPGVALSATATSVIRDYSFGVPPAASGEQPAPAAKKPRETHFDLGVGTEAPISVGGVATLEVPHRILFQVGVGILPQAYAEAIDGFLTGVGAYDATVSSIVKGSIASSFVLRTSIGLRPFSDHGFEILGGYTLMTGGGSVATADVLNAILVESGSAIQAPAGLGGEIPIGATLHNVHASIGWRWLLADDHLVIRASLSYLQTVASNIHVKVPETATVLVPYEGQINEQVNSYLGPYFSKYAKAPTLGLSAAVRF